jgi:hypothetical protein
MGVEAMNELGTPEKLPRGIVGTIIGVVVVLYLVAILLWHLWEIVH